MAVTMSSYAPYNNSPTYEEQWRPFMGRAVNDGVVRNVLSELLPFGDSTGMQVKVSSGEVWSKGQWGQSNPSGTGGIVTMPIASNSSGNPRRDLIVARNVFGNQVSTGAMTLEIIQGTPAATPVTPSPVNSTVMWDVVLGTVDVANGAVTISAANVKDARQWGGPPVVTVPDDFRLFGDKLSSSRRADIQADVPVGAGTTYWVAMVAPADVTISKVITHCSIVHTAGTVTERIYYGWRPDQLTSFVDPVGLSWPTAGALATGTFTATTIRAGMWVVFLLSGNASMAGLNLGGTASTSSGDVTNLLNPSTTANMTCGFKGGSTVPSTLNILDGTWSKRNRYFWCAFQ